MEASHAIPKPLCSAAWLPRPVPNVKIVSPEGLAARALIWENMWEVSAFFENIGVVHDGMNMISKPLEVVDHPYASELKVNQGKVEFEQIGFHYGGSEGVIDNLSLIIKPGEKIGVVGRSGASRAIAVVAMVSTRDLPVGVCYQQRLSDG